MKKRLLAMCLAAALLLGMLPTFTLPIAADDSTPTYRAAYATGVDINGVANEAPWYISGKIGANAKFGVMWGEGKVYIAIKPGKEETVSVKFAAGTLTVNKNTGVSGIAGAVATWGSDAVEIAVPFSAINVTLKAYNEVLPLQLKVGNATWNGNVILSNLFRDNVSLTPSKASSADKNNINLERNDNNFVYSNKYIAGAKNYNEDTNMCGWQYLVDHNNNTLVLDFDFTAVSMPSYGTASSLSRLNDTYTYYGYSVMHGDSNGNGYSIAITNTDSGLYLCINDPDDEEDFRSVKMNKKVGDTFHMRFERDASNVLRVYVDDVLLAKFDDPSAAAGWGRVKNCLNTNLYSGSKYMLPASGKHDVEVKVENMTAGYWDDSMLTTLTFNDIKGANKSEEAVDSKLNLITKWTNPVLKVEYALTWTSSNTKVIKNDGTVIRGEKDERVTITAKLGTAAEKSFTVIVPKKAVNAYFTTENLVVDGKLNETSWEHAKVTAFAATNGVSSPLGTVKALINKGVAYFAITYKGATSLKMSLGGKEWNLDLTKAKIEENGIKAVNTNGVVEMSVDMKAVGLQITDYNVEYEFQLTLADGDKTAKLETKPTVLIVEGKKVNVLLTEGGNKDAVNIDLDFTTKGHFKLDAEEGVLTGNFTNTGSKYAMETNAERLAMINKRRTMLLEQVLRIDAMPASNGDFTGFNTGSGYRIMLEEGMEVLISVLIYKDTNGKLQLKVWQDNTKKASAPIALGADLGEEFTLGLLRENDGRLSIYVNGMLLQRLETSVPGSNKGANGLYLYYKDSKCSASDPCSITISQMSMSVTGEEATGSSTTVDVDLSKAIDPQGWEDGNGIDKLIEDDVMKRYFVAVESQDSNLKVIDKTKDMLMELENFSIVSMPIGTGTFTAANSGIGLNILLEQGSSIITSVLIYNTASGLRAKIWTGNTPADFALGKKTGDTFKLGLLRKADGTASILVDGVEIGSAATRYILGNQGKNAVDLYYTDATCSASNPFQIKTSAIKLTASEAAGNDADSDGKTRLDLTLGVDPAGFENNGVINKDIVDNSYKRYFVMRQSENSQLKVLDKKKDILLEVEDFSIGAMPIGTGTFTAANEGIGLNFILEQGASIINSALVYNTASGLRIKIWTGDTPADFDLGKKTGDVFKLGLFRKNDGTVTVLVDDEVVGTVATAYLLGVYGTNAFAIYYSDANCTPDNICNLKASGITLTVTGEGDTEEEVSDDAPAHAVDLDLSKAIDPQGWENGGFIAKEIPDMVFKRYYVARDVENPQLKAIDTNNDILLQLTNMTILKMPVGTGVINNAADGEGLHILLEEGASIIISALIYNSGNGLRMKIWTGGVPADIDLGVGLGQTFNLSLLREYGGLLKVRVNGTEVGSAATSYTFYNQGKNALCLYYYDSACNTQNKFLLEVAGIKLAVTPSINNMIIPIPTLQEEMGKDVLIPGVDLRDLTTNLSLPTSFESTYLGKLDLKWTSSRTDVLGLNGKITRPNTKTDGYSVLGVNIAGAQEVWSEEVRVPTTYVAPDQTPANVMINFTQKFTENWTFNNKILSGMTVNGKVLTGKQVSVFGAQWNLNYLFFAVKTGDRTVGLTVNGHNVVLNDTNSFVKGDITYVAVTYSSVGMSAPNTYNKKVAVKITLGDGKWEGVLELTSNETFLVDDGDSDFPGGGTNGTATLHGSSGNPNLNSTGYKKTANGWQFYNRYDHKGTNPGNSRTYVILWGEYWGAKAKEYFAPIADRTRSTWCEFDFTANEMPIYDDGEDGENFSRVYASRGFTWALVGTAGDGVSMGIYNTEEGLTFVALESNLKIRLNKHVGDSFRIGTSLNTDGSLTLYIDGEQFAHIEDVYSTLLYQYGKNALLMNLIRNEHGATSSYDNFDLLVENITIAKGYGENRLSILTEEHILSSNKDEYEVTKKLKLPQELENPQTGWETELKWTSSDPDVINPETGRVTAPRGNGKLVTLTVTDGLVTRKHEFYVPASSYTSNILSVFNDLNPATGKGEAKDLYEFALDDNNNSIIYKQKESKAINYIVLTDSDEINRFHPDVLTIWTSDDNVTYNKMERGFKLLKVGNKVYLYDFTARGQYIKVHSTLYGFDEDELDFVGDIEEMIEVGYSDVFGAEGNFAVEKTVTVKNTKNRASYDEIYKVSLTSAGVKAGTEKSIRVYMGKQMLYHYVEGGNIIVRIPEIKAGGTEELRIISGNSTAIDISNKEYVHEVIYGTKQTSTTSIRLWMCSLPDGRLIGVGCDTLPEYKGVNLSLATETLRARSEYSFYCISEDGGMTWGEQIPIVETFSEEFGESDTSVGWINDPGGITYDPDAGELGMGRLIYTGYYYVSWNANNMASSDCKQRFMYSDDLGETWFRSEDTKALGIQPTYTLAYSDVVRVSCYDNEGPNVDYVLAAQTQVSNDGSFCGRVIYSCDGGLSWIMGPDQLLLEGDGKTGVESGLSEGFIMERESDHALVLYARNQYANLTKYARAISYDFGKTWKHVEESSVYASTNQPVMQAFGENNLLCWQGHHALGTQSYVCVPLNVGVFSDDLLTVSCIQDLYSRYSLAGWKEANKNKIVNQAMDSMGDTMSITYWSDRANLTMKFDNFTDMLYRNKGAFDSFENTGAKYEGWNETIGVTPITNEVGGRDGKNALKFANGASSQRSIRYMQEGTVSFSVYVADASKASFEFELEAAYGKEYGKAAPVAIRVDRGVLTYLGSDTDSGIKLKNGWNDFAYTVSLTDKNNAKATLSVNGGTPVSVPVNTSIGNYICSLHMTAVRDTCYLDNVIVTDTTYVDVPDAPEDPDRCVLEHKLVKTEGIRPTVLYGGRRAYYTCEVCGRNFLDSKGTQPLKNMLDLFVDKLGSNNSKDETPDANDPSVDVTPEGNDVNVVLIVVLSVLLAAAIAAGGVILYRKKWKKDEASA